MGAEESKLLPTHALNSIKTQAVIYTKVQPRCGPSPLHFSKCYLYLTDKNTIMADKQSLNFTASICKCTFSAQLCNNLANNSAQI